MDLARNDIGREAGYGTVEVEELMVVETYSHDASSAGGLRAGLEGCGALDRPFRLLAALSGAPKVRAMQIIDGWRRSNAAPGGAVGYLS